jgi:hypothetical protein
MEGVKRNALKPWQKQEWCIPPAQSSEFVAKMEDVLEVYKRPFNRDIPVVCMDEQPVQLLGEKLEPIAMNPHHSKQEDHEYVRKGTCNVFMFTEPLAGKRYVSVSEQRTKKDWTREVKALLTEHYPDAEKVVLVMDNLNTHTPSSFYELFKPDEARNLIERLEIHYTPKHGSWLNIAELELSALTGQCLCRRIDCIDKLSNEIQAWQKNRNAGQKTVNWQFTTQDARVKLFGLYPCF